MLLASASLCVCSIEALAQAPTANPSATQAPRSRQVPGPVLAPDVRSGKGSFDLILEPPTNSTVEIRTARRPWLLEKLIKPKKEPSVKMNPPRPPAEIFPDPPSMSHMPAPSTESRDGWQPRRADLQYRPSFVDLPAKETGNTNEPLATDPLATEPLATDPLATEPLATEPLVTEPLVTEPLVTEPLVTEPLVTEPLVTEPSEGANPEPAAPKSPAPEPNTNVLRPSELNEESVQPGSQLPLVDPKPTADGVADSLDQPNSKPPGSAVASPESSSVEVRELSIESDGTPTSDLHKQATVGDQPPAEPKALADHVRASQGSEIAVEPPSTGQPVAEPTEPEPPRVEVDYAGYARKPIRRTRTVQGMQNSMRQCLRYYYGHPENANERSNWGVLHSIMVYGADTKLLTGRKSYNAIAWIAGNNACRGQKLLIEKDGYIEARSGVGLQGHQAQMLAILSLCDVPMDYPLYAGDSKFTVADLVESEMWTCKRGEELTFTLIGLAHYVDTDVVWNTETGEAWDFEKLIREELAQSVVGAACGGTHRLMGFAHALRKRRAEGKPITGQWKRAEVYTKDFISYAYRLQNRDGSMTTDWFEGREDNGDLDRKIQTTGHIVEWLLTVTPDSQLQDRRLVSAIRFLLKSMYEERGRDWKIGPKGHALRSLAMYYERVYRSGPAWRTRSIAHQHSSSRR